MELFSGRTFSKEFSADKEACIVNESTIRNLGITNPFNTILINGSRTLSITGVIKNFNFESLHYEIGPYIFRLKSSDMNYWGYISMRLSKNASANTISEVKKTWNEYAPGEPFQYFFMDQDFANKFKTERQNARLAALFTLLALIIASMGLFGLVSFTVEQRTKEIGIRKTTGASVSNVFYLFSKEYILLIVISALISWPLIYLVAKDWLQNFYYRINLHPLDFLTGFMIAFLVAFITIGYKILRSARTNPVESLKYE